MIRSTPASLPTYTPSLRHAGLPDYLASAFITQPEKSRGLTTRHAEYLLQRWANQFRRQSARADRSARILRIRTAMFGCPRSFDPLAPAHHRGQSGLAVLARLVTAAAARRLACGVLYDFCLMTRDGGRSEYTAAALVPWMATQESATATGTNRQAAGAKGN